MFLGYCPENGHHGCSPGSTLKHRSLSSVLISKRIETDFLQEDETGLLRFDQCLTTPLAHAELAGGSCNREHQSPYSNSR